MRLCLFVIVCCCFFCATVLCGAAASRSRSKALTRTMVAVLRRWTGACQWPHIAVKQRRLCQKEGSLAVLERARSLVLTHCQQAFQYEPWNCSLSLAGTDFLRHGKVHRETSVLVAMVSAALTHSAARACAEGSVQYRCACKPINAHPLTTRLALRTGSCDDDVRAGRRFARGVLMQAALGDDPVGEVLRTSLEVGIKVVSSRTEEVCRCSGPNGSCVHTTCRRRLAPFSLTADDLRSRYYTATKVEPANHRRRGGNGPRRRRVTASTRLGYLERSPDLCRLTAGRRCLDDDNCARLCCLRGTVSRRVRVSRLCHFRWRPGAPLRLRYDVCRYYEEVRVCR